MSLGAASVSGGDVLLASDGMVALGGDALPADISAVVANRVHTVRSSRVRSQGHQKHMPLALATQKRWPYCWPPGKELLLEGTSSTSPLEIVVLSLAYQSKPMFLLPSVVSSRLEMLWSECRLWAEMWKLPRGLGEEHSCKGRGDRPDLPIRSGEIVITRDCSVIRNTSKLHLALREAACVGCVGYRVFRRVYGLLVRYRVPCRPLARWSWTDGRWIVFLSLKRGNRVALVDPDRIMYPIPLYGNVLSHAVPLPTQFLEKAVISSTSTLLLTNKH